MRAPFRVGLVIAGMLVAPLLSTTIPGCGSYFAECQTIVYGFDPGVYVPTNELQSAIGDDTDYRLEISADGKQVVETFAREGRTHRNVYKASDPVASELGSGPGDD